MKDLMKLELFHLKNSKLFWIMLALSFVLPIFSILLVLVILVAFGMAFGVLAELVKATSLTALFLQSMIGLSTTSSIFALITTGVVLSKEFTDGTMRNVILANKSRATMYFSYFFTSIIVGVSFLLCNFMAIMLLAAPIFGFGPITAGQACGAVFSSLGIGILSVCFVQSCVCMFLFCVRRQWATIVFPLLIIMLVPSIVDYCSMTLTLVLATKGIAVSEHLLIWTPFFNLSLFNPAFFNGELFASIVVYYLIFIAVFTVSGFFTFKNADLK